MAAHVLRHFGLDVSKIRKELANLVPAGKDCGVTMGRLPQTSGAKMLIEYAMEAARDLNHNYVGTEHLLLGLLRNGATMAMRALVNLGLKAEAIRTEVLHLLGDGAKDYEDVPVTVTTKALSRAQVEAAVAYLQAECGELEVAVRIAGPVHEVIAKLDYQSGECTKLQLEHAAKCEALRPLLAHLEQQLAAG